MRYVNPTPDAPAQNLVACQNGLEIYFYTLKPIVTGAELLVWYSHEFAECLQCPLPGELGEERLGRGLRVAGVPPCLRCYSGSRESLAVMGGEGESCQGAVPRRRGWHVGLCTCVCHPARVWVCTERLPVEPGPWIADTLLWSSADHRLPGPSPEAAAHWGSDWVPAQP